MSAASLDWPETWIPGYDPLMKTLIINPDVHFSVEGDDAWLMITFYFRDQI